MIRTRTSSTWLASATFILLALWSPPAGKCQDPVQEPNPNESMARAMDTRLTMRERMNALSSICALPTEGRTHRLRVLIRDADETVAAAAFAVFVQERDPDLGDTSLQRFGSWSEGNQRIVLQSILDKATQRASSGLLSISRGLLRECISSKRCRCESLSEPNPIDLAALALAYHGEHSDATLLEQAVRDYPGSHGIWLALTRLQHNKSTRKLAENVYRNQENSRVLRICAAASIASKDEEAAMYVSGAIQGFLETYSGKSVGESFPTLGVDRGTAKLYYEYRTELRVLGVLRFLDLPMAQKMVFEHIQSRNEHIRTITRLIAAMRWPKRFLMEAPKLGMKDKVDLLAVLVVYYPSFEQRARTAVSAEELQRSIHALRETGLRGLFGLAGAIVSCP